MQTQLVVNGTRNEKDWFILLKKEKTFQISGIKTNNLINQMQPIFKKLQWATITSIFLMTQFDWLESYSFHKGSVSFSHEAWQSNFLINTYHIGRVILFSIKLNCHIGTSIHLHHCSWSKSRWSVLNHFLSLWCSFRYFWEICDFWRNRLDAMRGRWSSPTIFTGGSSPLS